MDSTSDLSADRGPALSAYNAVMIAIPTVAVLIRFWSRALTESEKHSKFWWDDWAVLAALPFCIASNAMAIKLVNLGVGRHISTLPGANILEALKILWATYLIYDTGLTLAKISALFFYARIFGTYSKKFKFALWITHGLVISWWIGIVLGTIVMCNPVDKNWVPSAPGYCGSTEALWLGSAIPSVLIDLIILILPLPMLWGLRLRLSRKILICGVFICGYCVILVSIGRLVTVITTGAAINEDLTWAGVNALYWLGAETPITILSVCMPSLFFLYRRAKQHGPTSLFTTRRSGSRQPLHGYGAQSSPGNTNGRDAWEMQTMPKTSGSSQEELYTASTATQIAANAPPHAAPSSQPQQIHVSRDIQISRS